MGKLDNGMKKRKLDENSGKGLVVGNPWKNEFIVFHPMLPCLALLETIL